MIKCRKTKWGTTLWWKLSWRELLVFFLDKMRWKFWRKNTIKLNWRKDKEPTSLFSVHRNTSETKEWNEWSIIPGLMRKTQSAYKPLTFCSPMWFILLGKMKKGIVTRQIYRILNTYSCWIIISCCTHSLKIRSNSMSNVEYNVIDLRSDGSCQLWIKTVIWVQHTVLTCLEMLQLLESTLYLYEKNRW